MARTTQIRGQLRATQPDAIPASALEKALAEPRPKLDLSTGTRNMVKCLAVKKEDRVVIVTDNKTLRMGKKIKAAVEQTGAKAALVIMENFGKRPMFSLPTEMEQKIREFKPTVSFLATMAMEGELKFRRPLVNFLVGELNVRHAHGPHMNEKVAGGEAMCADYDEIHRITHAVLKKVKNAEHIVVTAPNGTSLRVELDPKNLKWSADDGRIDRQGMYHNLPGGEDFTCPKNVNGTFVTNLLGDHFIGLLKKPVTIKIEDGRAVSVSCDDKKLEAELSAYLKKTENADRVGEFAIGTNTAVTKLIGNMLCDEKAVGVHIAFGDPLAEHTGAKWSVNPIQHCDMVIQGCTIAVDGKPLMVQGKFII